MFNLLSRTTWRRWSC